MFQQALTPHESGIRLLAGPELFTGLRNIDPNACQRILTLAQASHPVVVVNSEDAVHAEQVKALACSEKIVLTLRLDLVSLHRAKQHLEFMTRNRVATADIHIVAMGTGHSGELPLKTVKNVLNVSTIHNVPDDSCATTMSINVGNPLVLESPKSKTSRAIAGLADVFLNGSAGAGRGAGGRQSALTKAAALLALNTLSYVK
jgi:Flp pilus assembly CpaE family ATPase